MTELPGAPAERGEPETAATGRHVAEVIALSVLLAVVMGVVWSTVSPTPTFAVAPDGLVYRSGFPSEYIAADGWFALLAAVAGVLVALYVVVRGRGRFGVPVILTAAVAGVLGSLLAWWLGHSLGPDKPVYTGREPVGTLIHGQLTVRADGVLFVWSILAVGVLMFVLAWQRPDDEADQQDVRVPVDGDEAASVGGDRQVGQVDGGQ